MLSIVQVSVFDCRLRVLCVFCFVYVIRFTQFASLFCLSCFIVFSIVFRFGVCFGLLFWFTFVLFVPCVCFSLFVLFCFRCLCLSLFDLIRVLLFVLDWLEFRLRCWSFLA